MTIRRLSSLALLWALLSVGTVVRAQTAPSQSAAAKRHRKKKHRKPSAENDAIVVASNGGARSVARTTTQAGVIHTRTSTALRVASARRRRGHRPVFSPWTEPTYADSTVGDSVEGEDPIIRKAALDALGAYNGTVVVADPSTGRILSIVNQKLALKGAYQPCSTVKMVVSLASLSEGLVNSESAIHLTRRYTMDLTQAIAHSNNLYFAKLGQQLGFERVEKYAKLYGLGEKAGLDIPGEEPGYLTSEPPATGVGMMTSFGDGIRLTPLELTSIVSTIANGGTMYYLQYPKSADEIQKFIPRIKRTLDIADLIPQIRPGMLGAVEYGTARRANFDPTEPVFGKTGTCTDTAQPGVHLGWFGSFNDAGKNKLVTIVLLTGGRGISGPTASGVAGNFYHNLTQQHYFTQESTPAVPTSLVSLDSHSR